MSNLFPWFAVRVRQRLETLVEEALSIKGYSVLLPVYGPEHRKAGYPLFAGYLFCQFSEAACGRIVTTPGVLGIVRFGRTPAPISQAEIDCVSKIVREGVPRETCPYVSRGCRVKIGSGPLAGGEGVLENGLQERFLIVSITILQRSVKTRLNGDTVLLPC